MFCKLILEIEEKKSMNASFSEDHTPPLSFKKR